MKIYADTSVLFSLYVTDANFCTLDTRQGKLAQLAGLLVQP